MMNGMDEFPTEGLRRTILDMGADLAGFADLRILPGDIRDDFPRAVAIAKRYDPDVIRRIKDGPTREYLEFYKQLNLQLNAIGKRVAAYIEELGFNAKPLKATVLGLPGGKPKTEFKPLGDIQLQLPHKTIATLAGLGWIGKTDLLITDQFGPRIRLASILTDAPFTCDTAIIESRCGDCVACAEACPVDAGRKVNWRQDAPPGKKYDTQKCYDYTKKITINMSFDHHLCGICIAACPIGQENV